MKNDKVKVDHYYWRQKHDYHKIPILVLRKKGRTLYVKDISNNQLFILDNGNKLLREMTLSEVCSFIQNKNERGTS